MRLSTLGLSGLLKVHENIGCLNAFNVCYSPNHSDRVIDPTFLPALIVEANPHNHGASAFYVSAPVDFSESARLAQTQLQKAHCAAQSDRINQLPPRETKKP